MTKLFLNSPYRYSLTREVGANPRRLLWVMANPSTADDDVDDPTIRKVKGFTARLGYGRLTVCNLYAFRATDPKVLRRMAAEGVDIIGPENQDHLARWAGKSMRIVVAWGACLAGLPGAPERIRDVLQQLYTIQDRDIYCLGHTKNGDPRHPLMVPYATPLHVYDPPLF